VKRSSWALIYPLRVLLGLKVGDGLEYVDKMYLSVAVVSEKHVDKVSACNLD
jgi:hypothetical protein